MSRPLSHPVPLHFPHFFALINPKKQRNRYLPTYPCIHLLRATQLLAAHSYAQDTEGVHFVDPQAWVTQNLFKATSVWDIPLMKPRFACAIPNPTALPRDDAARADALSRSLDFFRMGGACENGLVALEPRQQ